MGNGRSGKKRFRVGLRTCRVCTKTLPSRFRRCGHPRVCSNLFRVNSQLSPQARQVHGIAVPVPKEIFRSLDQFRDANWRAIKRPEVARWKSHGDQAQIATLLGIVIAEGFIAMESEDSTEVKDLGRTVLALARGLGVGERALRRSRSIMELADKSEWVAARQEWDGVLSDIEGGMIELKSAQLAQLVSIGGWLRGTEALSALSLQRHSSEGSALIRQPALVDYLEKQLLAMSSEIRARPIVAKLLDGTRRIRALVEGRKWTFAGRNCPESARHLQRACAAVVTAARLNSPLEVAQGSASSNRAAFQLDGSLRRSTRETSRMVARPRRRPQIDHREFAVARLHHRLAAVAQFLRS